MAIATATLVHETGAWPVARPVWPLIRNRNTRSLYRYAITHTGNSIGTLDRPSNTTLAFRLRQLPGTYC
jgi:hypothetical protein